MAAPPPGDRSDHLAGHRGHGAAWIRLHGEGVRPRHRSHGRRTSQLDPAHHNLVLQPVFPTVLVRRRCGAQQRAVAARSDLRPDLLQSAGRCPRLGTLVLTDEPSQRSNGGPSCHGGAPAAHGELGHRRPRPSTDGTGCEVLTPPSRRRAGRRGDGRSPPRRRRAPTCGRRGSASVDTGRPGSPRPGPACRARRPPDGA